jgi:hypothetical protein
MRSLYARHQRASISDPATIGDNPQEMLRKAFIYLLPGKRDLLAPSESCRAWRPVAQELMHSRQVFGEDRKVEQFLCGFHLQSLVFRMGSISINCLELDMRLVSIENALLLAQIAAPSLSILNLGFRVGIPFPTSLDCYAALDVFFKYCPRIKSLILSWFNFGDDPESISPTIKEGFGRLKKLDLTFCSGDILMSMDAAPIRDLRDLIFCACSVGDSCFIEEIAENCRALTSIYICDDVYSSASFLKVTKVCRDIERITLDIGDEGLLLESSDFEAFASLPRLKYLDIKCCIMTEQAASFLSRCRQLKHLEISWSDGVNDVLRVIGKNLISLNVWGATCETWLGVIENCPNLVSLELDGEDLDSDVMMGSLNDVSKKRMKRLASLKVKSEAIRLGTDWEGY